MIRISILLGLSTLIISSCGNRKNNKPVNVTLFYTQQYCGGAAPDDEIVEQSKIPKPYTDTLYLHQNPDRLDDGVALVFNAQGKAKLAGVSEGTYFGFKYPKIDPTTLLIDPTKPGDPLCEFNFQNMEMIPLNIEATTRSITDTIKLSCNPCNEEIPMMPPPDMEPAPDLEDNNK